MGGQGHHPGHGASGYRRRPGPGLYLSVLFAGASAHGLSSPGREPKAHIHPSAGRGRQYPPGQPGGRLHRGGPKGAAERHPHRPGPAAGSAAPGILPTGTRAALPGKGRHPAAQAPKTARLSSPMLQIPVSSPLLPAGPPADTGGLFHAPGAYQAGPLPTAVPVSPPQSY